MRPGRFIKRSGEGQAYLSEQYFHMGYARSIKDIEYKINIHGHKNEWRAEWMEMYRNWKYGMNDVHPTCEGIWNPEPFDKTTLPELMRDHPYYDLEAIV